MSNGSTLIRSHQTEGQIAAEVEELVREARVALLQARVSKTESDRHRLAERAAKPLNQAHAMALGIRNGAYPHLADKVRGLLTEACALAGRQHDVDDLTGTFLTPVGRRRFRLTRIVAR